jgi:cytochrome c oxidase subunit 2
MWLQADQPGYYWAQCAEYCGESHANMKFRVVSLDTTDFAAWSQRQLAEARTAGAPAAATTQLNEADTPRFQLASAALGGATGASDAGSPFAHWRMMQAEPPAGVEDAALIARGRDLFTQKSCGACHAVRGHGSLGNIGPDLTHFGSRTTIAAAVLDNTPENLHRWLADPNGVKPGNIMWKQGYLGYNIQLTSADVDALVAYLHSLK